MTYTPKVGDRVRLPYWTHRGWVDVEHVGRTSFMGIDNDGDDYYDTFDLDWQLVERIDPLPDMWINVYDTWVNGATSIDGAHARLLSYDRTALVHIWTDNDGVDRIERVPLEAAS